MESILQLKRLRSVLTDNRPLDDDRKKEEWDEKNADAVACIRLSLSDGQILQFANETDAKCLWKAIHDALAGPAEDRAIDAGEELRNIKMMDNERIYKSRERLVCKMWFSGIKHERQLVYNVVRGLHNKFSQIREILKTQREKKLDEILEIIKEKEREIQKKNNGRSDNDTQEGAYTAKNHHKKNNKKRCYVCEKMGHLSKNCYYRKDKPGQGTFENSKKNKRDNRGNLDKNANCASEDRVDFATFQAFNASTCPRLKDNKWIIDSGCTSHMTFNRSYFVKFKPIRGKVYLAGRNNVVESKGIGSIKVKVRDDKGIINYVIMYDVVYVPDLRNNLLSVMKLMDHGLKVNFVKHAVKICQKNSGEVIAVGERLNDHFVIDMIPMTETNANVCNNTNLNNKGNKDTTIDKFYGNIENKWHRRLGHVNNKYLQTLIKENLATGINNKIGKINCEACKSCKLSRKPHKSVIYEQSNEVLELLHLDICGPCRSNLLEVHVTYYLLLMILVVYILPIFLRIRVMYFLHS